MPTAPPTLRPGPTRPLSPDWFGVNHQAARETDPWADAGRRRVLKALGVATLRYPGGTVANFWDMRSDRLFGADVIDPTLGSTFAGKVIARGKIGRNPIDDLAHGLRSTDTAATFVVNLATPGADTFGERKPPRPGSDAWVRLLDERLARSCGMLDRAAAAGLPVTLVELGNEYYLNLRDDYPMQAYPDDGRSYADACTHAAKHLKRRYPGVRVAAVGSATSKVSVAERRKRWNANVVARLDRDWIDAVTLHLYPKATGLRLTDARDWREAMRMMDGYLDACDRVATARRDVLDAGWPVWVTEYDFAFGDDADDAWAAALGLAAWTDRLLAEPGVERLQVHQFKRLIDGRGADARLTARGRVVQAIAHAGVGAPAATPWISDAEALVRGHRFDHPDGTARGVVLNLTEQTQAISHPLPGTPTRLLHAPLEGAPTIRNSPPSDTLELPAFSVVVLNPAGQD